MLDWIWAREIIGSQYTPISRMSFTYRFRIAQHTIYIHKRLHKHTHKLTTRLYTSSYIPFRRFQFCFGTHDRSTINCQYMSLYKEFYVYKCVSILYLNFKMKTTKKNACATYIIRISISFANCINHILFFISWWEINTFSFAKKIYIWTKQNQ